MSEVFKVMRDSINPNSIHIGMAGEVRLVVRREDGTAKEDTGFRKNLILNKGLDFFGGGNGSNMLAYCAIGSGNSEPSTTQTQLDSFVAITSGSSSSSKYDYTPDSSNLYKTNSTYKYTFTGLDNINISEVGLASQGSSGSNYYLCTRALIKDSEGSPTSVSILSGEVLEVYYRIWRVISTLDVSYIVNMLDGKGGKTPYNVIVRPAILGSDVWASTIGFTLNSSAASTSVSSSDLASLTSSPSGASSTGITNSLSAYVIGSYKQNLVAKLSISSNNYGIRTVSSANGSSVSSNKMFWYQARFGSVVGDNPIPKDSTKILSIPIEFSWGRYEGAL